jgi:hypothetical protein
MRNREARIDRTSYWIEQVWMHFQRRLFSRVRRSHRLDEAAYAALKEEKLRRKLHTLQIANKHKEHQNLF